MCRRKKIATSCLVLALALAVQVSDAQNDLLLQMESGEPFTALLNDRPVNKSPQSHVAVRDLSKDTVLLKIELEGGARFGVTFYLLDKGRKTAGKEFSYILRRQKNRLQPVFMGMRDH